MQETWVLMPGSGRSPGGGHGNPLQYSCLENPIDRGAWWATVHCVTKSQIPSMVLQRVGYDWRDLAHSHNHTHTHTHTHIYIYILCHLMWRTDSLEKTLMLGKFEGRRRRGQQRIRWLNGIQTWWTWVWVNSRSCWWTWRPGVLQSTGLQRAGHDWTDTTIHQIDT